MPDSLRSLRLRAGLTTPAAAADWLGLHARTVRRYEAADAAPGPVLRALALRSGDLGALSPAWAGWYLEAGRLYERGMRRGETPADVRAGGALRAHVGGLLAQVRACHREIAELRQAARLIDAANEPAPAYAVRDVRESARRLLGPVAEPPCRGIGDVLNEPE